MSELDDPARDVDDDALGILGIADSSDDFIAAAGERIASRGRQERRWYEGWRNDYDGAVAAGDDDACELLLDVLVAFDAFQGSKHPTRLRRIA